MLKFKKLFWNFYLENCFRIRLENCSIICPENCFEVWEDFVGVQKIVLEFLFRKLFQNLSEKLFYNLSRKLFWSITVGKMILLRSKNCFGICLENCFRICLENCSKICSKNCLKPKFVSEFVWIHLEFCQEKTLFWNVFVSPVVPKMFCLAMSPVVPYFVGKKELFWNVLRWVLLFHTL